MEKIVTQGHSSTPTTGATITTVKERPPSRSGSSSARSTPSLKSKDVRSCVKQVTKMKKKKLIYIKKH